MLDRYDESQLLDFIEGELDEKAAATLQQRLAGDSRAAELLGRMRNDRAALRSTPEPELPMDFLERIEPLLARPMLMEHLPAAPAVKPGEFRRQYRKRTRRIRWGRLAVAATLMFTSIAGIWAAINGSIGPLKLRTPAPGIPDLVAKNQNADASGLGGASGGVQVAGSTASQEPWALSDGTIHHHHPLPLPLERSPARLAAMNAGSEVKIADKSSSPTSSETPRRTLAAGFAIVVQAPDLDQAEQTVQRALSKMETQNALVRNFSFAEAQRLEEQWRLANRGSGGAAEHPRVAGVEGHGGSATASTRSPLEIKRLAERVREYLNADGRREIPSQRSLLAGAETLSPSLEQQLDFSSRGATYTVAIPASQLSALLEQLSLNEQQPTALRLFSARNAKTPLVAEPGAGAGAGGSSPWQPLLFWLGEGPAVRQEIERIAKAPSETIVLVPLAVRPGGAPPRHSHTNN